MQLDQMLLSINTRGFCVIRDVIPPDRCESIRQNIAAIVQRDPGKYATAVKGVHSVPGVINQDQSFAPYLADERLMGLVGALLGEHSRISFTTGIFNVPGNDRGIWHADWPFNQNNIGHIESPYPDAVMHLTTLWMLSPFTKEGGGTFVVPGSHHQRTNPTGQPGIDPCQPIDAEMNATGPVGSVLVFDSRLWHATSPIRTNEPRVALAVRYAPWWLCLDVLRDGSDQRNRMVGEAGKGEKGVPAVQRDVFDRLPAQVKPLFRHWVAD